MTNAPLISRLAEAKEGMRELSDDVLLALGWERKMRGFLNTNRVFWAEPYVPDPSRSLDDAVDLVPEGWWFNVSSGGDEQNGRWFDAQLEKIERGPDDQPIVRETEGGVATPAIALVICIIKAMETGDG